MMSKLANERSQTILIVLTVTAARNESRHSEVVRPDTTQTVCSDTETSQSLGISYILTVGIVLSRQRKTKGLIKLHRCLG